MAKLVIYKTSTQTFVAMTTSITANMLKAAKIADPKSASLFDIHDKKTFEFDFAENPYCDKNGILVPTPSNPDAPISFLFEIDPNVDAETVKYKVALLNEAMSLVEKNVSETAAHVLNVKVDEVVLSEEKPKRK